jgi:hypothetical protein
MTSLTLPLSGIRFFRRVSGFVPAGQVFVVPIGKGGDLLTDQQMRPDRWLTEEPFEFGVISREKITDEMAVDAIALWYSRREQQKYEYESIQYWIDHYDSPPDEALGRAGADE